MWWHDKGRVLLGSPTRSHVGPGQATPCSTISPRQKLMRAIAALAVAALSGGCFQPLYGEQSPAGGGPILRDQLRRVGGQQIAGPQGTDEGRVARVLAAEPTRFAERIALLAAPASIDARDREIAWSP